MRDCPARGDVNIDVYYRCGRQDLSRLKYLFSETEGYLFHRRTTRALAGHGDP